MKQLQLILFFITCIASITLHPYYYESQESPSPEQSAPHTPQSPLPPTPPPFIPPQRPGMMLQPSTYVEVEPDLSTYNYNQLYSYFARKHYCFNRILNHRTLYMNDDFVKLAKQLPGYEHTIESLFAEFNTTGWQRAIGILRKGTQILEGRYRVHLHTRINNLHKEIMAKRAHALATTPSTKMPPAPTNNNNVPLIEPEIIPTQESTYEYEQQVAYTYHEHEPLIEKEATEWAPLQSLHHEYRLENYHYFTNRINALEKIATQGADYSWQSYDIDPPLLPLLATYHLNKNDFSSCYGNQLQHTIHTECLALLNRTTTLPTQDHVPALVHFIDAACTYNQEGLTHNSTKLLDFCWTLVECAAGIVEGACDGAIGAVSQLAHHPIETLITVATRGTLLNFQLCRIMYDLADLQATMLLDQEAGNKKFDDYFAPLTTIIMAIQDKKFTVCEGLKTTATIVVGMIAQSIVLNGLENFYSNLKDKALAYVHNNPLATTEHYTITPDGLVSKSVADQPNTSNTPTKTKKISRAQQAKEFKTLPKVI